VRKDEHRLNRPLPLLAVEFFLLKSAPWQVRHVWTLPALWRADSISTEWAVVTNVADGAQEAQHDSRGGGRESIMREESCTA